MLNAATSSTCDVYTRAAFDTCKNVRLFSRLDIVAGLTSCQKHLLVSLQSAKTSEWVYGPESVASVVNDEPIGRSGVCIFKVVDLRDVQLKVDEAHDPSFLGSVCVKPSPSKAKLRAPTTSPLFSRNNFSLVDSLLFTLRNPNVLEENPSIKTALD